MKRIELNKKEVVVNRFGLKVEIVKTYIESEKEWYVNEYSAAKLMLYKDATYLYRPDVEKRKIEELLNKGGML